jgi:RNA polymerase sigma factor (sigma-70 family)
MDLHETFTEWIKTQPKEVQEEFEDMEDIQNRINNREMPVSQIYYGDKPISRDAMEAIRYTLEKLTDRQREVYQLYHVEKMTQEEVAERLGISQQMICQHMDAIRKKIEKII